MKYLLAIVLLCLCAGSAQAGNYHLLDADDVSLEGYKIINNRDQYWPYADAGIHNNGYAPGQEHWTNGIAANLNLNLIELDWFKIYADFRVHGESTNEQFRQIGLQYETGLEISKKVDFYWFHHSQHLLDAEPAGHFPLQNYVGVRIHFVHVGE